MVVIRQEAVQSVGRELGPRSVSRASLRRSSDRASHSAGNDSGGADAPRTSYDVGTAWTCCAAQRKPTNSRATAIAIIGLGFPRLLSRR